MNLKRIVIVAAVVILLSMLLIPQNAQALGIVYNNQHDPARPGTDNYISFSITNNDPQQVYIKGVEVTWEWRTTPYVESGLNVAIASGVSGSVGVDFDVPENVPITTQSGTAIIFYTVGSSSGSQQSQSLPIEIDIISGIDVWMYIFVILIIAVVIIVVSVVYLYVKKKPQVTVHKHVQEVKVPEKEEPKTRIRAPVQQAGAGGATEIVAVSGATVVSAPQGGLEVSFPKGGKKVVQNELIIGRKDFEKLIDSSLLPRISKSHLRIYKEGDSFFIEDGYRGKASTNGTKLNGKEIRGAGPQPIAMNSTLSIADVTDLQIIVR